MADDMRVNGASSIYVDAKLQWGRWKADARNCKNDGKRKEKRKHGEKK